MIRLPAFSIHELLVLLAALLSCAGLIPAAPHEGQLDAELHRLHEAVGKDHELSLERRLDITARTASLIANQMFCKTGEIQGPSCSVLERNAKQLEALKGWALRSEGWERILASLSLFHVGRNYWYQENYDRSLLAVEQSIALKLFPYQTAQALEAWQRALVHPKSGYARQRQELADALVLQADCLLEMGQGDRNIVQLEKAMQALQLAAALVHNNKESSPDTYTHMTVMAMQIASAAVDVLNRLRMSSIHELMDTHGVTCKGCTDKGALLRQLVPRLNLPVVMLSTTSSLISPVEDPLANDMLPTLKSPKETQQQYMRRQFRSLLGMVHNHLLEELQVTCARRTQEGFCASYLPPWTWEAGDDTGAASEPSACSDPSADCSGQCSSSRVCSKVDRKADVSFSPHTKTQQGLLSRGSSHSNDSDQYAGSCEYGALPCIQDPDPAHWQPSSGPISDSADTVHLGGVDTIIFTSAGQQGKAGHAAAVLQDGQLRGAAGSGREGEAEDDSTGRGDPKTARQYSPGSLHDSVRETLDRQLKEQLAKTADASSQHDDPLVLLTLLGCILACLGLYLIIKHKRRISRFFSSQKGRLSSTNNERSVGYASLGASGANPTANPNNSTPNVAQSRKAIAASLREALAAGDVDKVQAVLGAAEDVGLEPTSSLLQRAQALVQQKKRRERSQQQGAKGTSNKKDKSRKVPKISNAEANGVPPPTKDRPPSLARISASSSAPSEVPQHDQPPLRDLTNAPPKPAGRLRRLMSLLSFKKAKKTMLPATDSSSSPEGTSPASTSPRAYTLNSPPLPSSTIPAAEPDPPRGEKRSTSSKSSKSRQPSKPSSTTHSSDTEPFIEPFPDDEGYTEPWQETGKKSKQRSHDKLRPRRSLVSIQPPKVTINPTPLLSASLLAQLPGSNYASPIGLFVSSSDVSAADGQTTTPPPQSTPANDATSPQYPAAMPIPTPVAPSPAQSPAPSWMSWLSATSNFAPASQPGSNPVGKPTVAASSLPPPLFSESKAAKRDDPASLASTGPGPLSNTLQYLGSDKVDIPGLLSSGAINPSVLSPINFITEYNIDSPIPTTAPTTRPQAAKSAHSSKAERAAPRATSTAAGRPVLYSQVLLGNPNAPPETNPMTKPHHQAPPLPLPTKPHPESTPSSHSPPHPAPQVTSSFGPHSISAAPFTPSSLLSNPMPNHITRNLPVSLDDDPPTPFNSTSLPLPQTPPQLPPAQPWNVSQSEYSEMYKSVPYSTPNPNITTTVPQPAYPYPPSMLSRTDSPISLTSAQPNSHSVLTPPHYPSQHTTRMDLTDPSILLPQSLSPLHALPPPTSSPRPDHALPNLPTSLRVARNISALSPSNLPYPQITSYDPAMGQANCNIPYPKAISYDTAVGHANGNMRYPLGMPHDPAMGQTNANLPWTHSDAPIPNELMSGLGGSLWDPMVSFDMNGNEDAWSSSTRRLQEWLQVDTGVARSSTTTPVADGNDCRGMVPAESALGASPPDSLGDANEWIHDLLKHVMD